MCQGSQSYLHCIFPSYRCNFFIFILGLGEEGGKTGCALSTNLMNCNLSSEFTEEPTEMLTNGMSPEPQMLR